MQQDTLPTSVCLPIYLNIHKMSMPFVSSECLFLYTCTFVDCGCVFVPVCVCVRQAAEGFNQEEEIDVRPVIEAVAG